MRFFDRSDFGGIKMKFSVLVIVVVGLAFASQATGQDADPAQRALEYAESQQKNSDALRTYSWKTRTVITKDEKPMMTMLIQARFDADGKLQHTTISSESHVEKKRGVRGKKQKKKIEELGQMIENVVRLQASYVIMSKGQLVDFFGKADVQDGLGEMAGTKRIHAKSVLAASDELTIWVDPPTGLNRKLALITPLDEKTVVDGTIDYKTLKDGPTTASVSVLRIPSQGISIKSERFDFIKQL
jgi:hypothetical protein